MSTKIIAHRGAWKEFNLPENSIAALQKAINLKCFAVELDVHLTKDEVVVVNHDYDFYGLNIETSTYNDLLIKKHPNGEQIPTLATFFDIALNQTKINLFLEIKSSEISSFRTEKLINTIIKNLPKEANENNVAFILFDFSAAVYLKQKMIDFNVYYLEGDKSAQEIKEAGLNGMDYHYKLLLENPEIIKSFKKENLKTNTWTVNDVQIAQKLISYNIDYLTTDYPKTFLDKGLQTQ